MNKRLVVMTVAFFVVLFLVSPTIKYSESFCQGSPLKNCRASYTTHFGSLFGGYQYLSKSVKLGEFVPKDEYRRASLVHDAPFTPLGGSPDEDQYFKPLLEGAVAAVISVLLAFILKRQNPFTARA